MKRNNFIFETQENHFRVFIQLLFTYINILITTLSKKKNFGSVTTKEN